MTLRTLVPLACAFALALASGAVVAACDSDGDAAATGDDDSVGGNSDTSDDDTVGGMDHGDDTMAVDSDTMDHDDDTMWDLDTSASVMSADGSYMVSYVTTPSPIPHNEHFDVTVTVMGGDDHDQVPTDLTVLLDGNMPAHGHGMNVTPEITDHGDGTWTAEGMLFHMQGHWEMTVSISHMAMEPEAAVFNVMVGN